MPSFARASLLASFNKGVDGKSFNICFNFVRYDDIEPIDVNTDQRSMASQPHPQPSQPQISDSVPGTQPKSRQSRKQAKIKKYGQDLVQGSKTFQTSQPNGKTSHHDDIHPPIPTPINSQPHFQPSQSPVQTKLQPH